MGGVASSEDRDRRTRSGKEPTEQATGTVEAVTIHPHLLTPPTNTHGPSDPQNETAKGCGLSTTRPER
ncbi:hypothetical protein NDU88_006192 [Pleurodeles waltl]|uniref:Uncharacterized protein n=1 Tax=Pleurodeles waltl TaxID=8319 RepID=A0AAV7VNX7_PLEWA|nr:hypothetical protein NDU88_006192 [Pleurodeles waltl]